MNKKGVSTSMINWVFVMIAGAVILIFIFKIINSQSEITELQVSAELLEDMGSVLVGRSVSENSFTEITVPSDKIFLFKCNGYCNPNTGCDSYVKSLAGDKQVETKIRPIFSAEKIKFTPRIYSFVESWEIPFNVVNFVYLAYPGQKFVFPNNDDCSGLCSKIYNRIPEKLKTAKIVVEGDTTGNNKFVKKIFFGTCPPSSSLPTGNQKGVCITNDEIKFYDTSENSWGDSFNYLTEEEILGAIFTEDAQTYECNMRKAEYKYINAIDIYTSKINKLKSAYSSRTNCLSKYNDFEISTPYSLSYTDFFNELGRLKSSSIIQKVEMMNRYLMRNDCSPIY